MTNLLKLWTHLIYTSYLMNSLMMTLDQVLPAKMMALEPESFLKNHLKLWMQPLKKILELLSLKNNPRNNNYIFTMKKTYTCFYLYIFTRIEMVKFKCVFYLYM